MKSKLCIGLILCVATLARADDRKFDVAKTLKVGGDGGWDYVTVDSGTHRLYVTRSSHTQVIDATDGKVLADIPGQKRSQNVS